ncbi:hypothetical protein FBUS_05534 [Fasciolopsis buskii]|uniref:Uncharacterized protein n=1 Tax=Fasciolopsis buskii TaxID=27845 RepID=A0A8E0VE26_9TREM|nr:hypothetical protein FBUS_05534 [Fasciolopsis buski]
MHSLAPTRLISPPAKTLKLKKIEHKKNESDNSTEAQTQQTTVANVKSGDDDPGTTVPKRHSPCLRRPGNLGELRPSGCVTNPSETAISGARSTVCNSDKSKLLQNRMPGRPAYELPPVRDPRISHQNSSLSAAGNSKRGNPRVNFSQVKSSSPSAAVTTLRTYPRRRIQQPNTPMRPAPTSGTPTNSGSNVSATHFPGRGRRLGGF